MIESLITSKTRLKLLYKFFLNNQNTSYLRDLEHEFGESTNAIRMELNRLENAKLLVSNVQGNKKYYKSNTEHPLYGDINSIIQKAAGLDQIIEKVLSQAGGLKEAWLIGELAKGINSDTIDLLLVGENINHKYIASLIDETEKIISKKIHFLILRSEEKENFFGEKEALLLWQSE